MMCELCLLAKGNLKTEYFYSDNVVTVVRCLSDNQVMIVLKRHGEATKRELGYMESIANRLFLFSGIRKEPRKIPDHTHWHLENAEYVGFRK